MYTEEIVIDTLFVNRTNQIEVTYFVIGKNDGVEVFRRHEGRVWSPTDDMTSDTLSGAHPDVRKLALAYWTPAIITEFSDTIVAQQEAERHRQADAIAAAQAAIAEAEATKAAAEKAQADAKSAADAAEAEAQRLTQALAIKKAAEEAKAAQDAFEAAVAAEIAKRTAE